MGFKLMDRKIEGLQGKDVMEALQTALAEDNETQNMTHAQVTEKQRMLEYFAEIPTNHNNQLFLSGEGRITQEDKALVLPHGKRFMDSFFADVAQKNVELAQDLGIDPATLRAPQEKISTTQQQAAELVKENLDSLPPTIAPLAGKEIKLAPTAANINFATPSHTQTL